jgi:hypothetical protein
MARDMEVRSHPITRLWRDPIAGGRSLDSWIDDRSERLLKAIALVMWTGILAVASRTAALAGVIAEHPIEQAKHGQPATTATLDDDFDHLIARLQSDAQYLSEHLRRLKDITNDPRVGEALRVANLPEEEPT